MQRRLFLQGGSAALASFLAGCGGGGGGGAAAADAPGGVLTTAPAPVAGGVAASVPGAPAPAGAAPAAGPATPASTGQVPLLTDNQLVANAKWNDPCVLAENGGYTMYASCGDGFSGDISIYRMRSTDRLTWTLSPGTPVLVRGAAGSWDQRAVETPSVVYFGGQYHMFYTAYPADYADSKAYRIGHAVSSDGIRWTKDASFFLGPTDPANATPTMDFRQYVCAEPGAVVVGNKLFLYFTAIGANAQVNDVIQTIGLTVLDPATGWSQPRMVLLPDQSAYPRSSCYGFSTPAACVLPTGQVALFYSIVQASSWSQVGIGNAVSANGQDGWRLDTLPRVGRDVPWRSREVLAPAALVDAAGTHLWFAGNDGASLGIGYMRLG